MVRTPTSSSRRVASRSERTLARRAAYRRRSRSGRTEWVRDTAIGLAGLALLAMLLGYELSGLEAIRRDPWTGANFVSAVDYVAAHHRPGELVFVAWPPPAYLGLGNKNDLIFVSGPLDRPPADIYARRTNAGQYVDNWIGVRAIVTTGELCNAMLTAPDLWLIVDRGRLRMDWAYAGDRAKIMMGLTYDHRPESDSRHGMVRRLAPVADRDPEAVAICDEAMKREGLVTD